MHCRNFRLVCSSFLILIVLVHGSACHTGSPSLPPLPAGPGEETLPLIPAEHPVTRLPLAGQAARAEAEFSGLAWYGETLVLLPQYPARLSDHPGGALLGLPKQALLDFLDGRSAAPLEPFEIPLETGGLERDIPGFEGFEAVAFQSEQVFLAVEARRGLKMRGYLVGGEIAPDLSAIRLDRGSLVEIPLPADLLNQSDEALLIEGEEILSFYEVNDPAHNPQPVARRSDLALRPLDPVPFPPLPYRLTDACPADEQGRFWAINYFYPGDRTLRVDLDPLVEAFGEGLTHASSEAVERLVELQYKAGEITLTGAPPLQLQLLDEGARNWEGLACLEGRGFFLVTDKFPETILGFVEAP